MLRLSLLFSAVLLIGNPSAPAVEGEKEKPDKEEHGEREGVVGTAIGKAREQLKEYGERPKVRARDLSRTVYGNRSARVQEALRQTAVIEDSKKLMEKFGAKILGPGLLLADTLSGPAGHLSVGDYRGAGTALVNAGAREVAAGMGAAGAMWMLGTAGFSVGGPIGGAVGGAVGAVATVIGYDMYLSEKVKGVAEGLWGEEKDPAYYLELARSNREAYLAEKAYYVSLARANRGELLANQQRAIEMISEKTGFVPYRPGQAEPPETSTRISAAGAQTGLDAVPPGRLIPVTCTVRTWNSKGNYPMILHIRNNQVAAKTGESLPPGTSSGSFTGQMSDDGRVMTGSWRLSDGSWSTEKWTFQPDHRVHLSVTWHWTKPKPSSTHGTLTISWHITQQD